MLYWALIFLAVSLAAGVMGWGGVSQAAAGISKFLLIVAFIGFAVFLVIGIVGLSAIA